MPKKKCVMCDVIIEEFDVGRGVVWGVCEGCEPKLEAITERIDQLYDVIMAGAVEPADITMEDR